MTTTGTTATARTDRTTGNRPTAAIVPIGDGRRSHHQRTINDGRRVMKRHCLLVAVAMLACSLASRASAEVHVEGDLNSLRVTASREALSDVLSAFAAQLHVRLRTAVPLTGEINGAYSGSFSQVVARLLSGYNYVIKTDRAAAEFIIFGQGSEVATPPKAPPARVDKGVMSRWR
jgi:hypothetical protein